MIANAGGDFVGTIEAPVYSLNKKLPIVNVELIRIGDMELTRQHPNGEFFPLLGSLYPETLDKNVQPRFAKTLTIVHVLWLKWENGVAFRMGIGMVLQEAWDAADADEVDIRLG